MSVFADSSALVKLYADEQGSEEVHALRGMVVSAVARVEVPAALWRKQRTGELSAADAELLCRRFSEDLQGRPGRSARFSPIGVSAALLADAAALVADYPLRAYDAVQLACALAARDALPDCTRFACFDVTLMRAASAHGFAPLGPGAA